MALVEDVAQLQSFQTCAYIADAGTDDFYAACAVPRAGRLTRIAHVIQLAQVGAATYTIYKNGTSTGITFTTTTTAVGDGELKIFTEAEKDLLEFEPGDSLEFRATTSATSGGARFFYCDFDGGGDVADLVQTAKSADLGSASESAHMSFMGRGKIAALAGVAYTATDGAPLLTLYRNGETTNVTIQLVASDLDVAKDVFLYEFNPAEMDALDFDKDDVFTILSDGDGTAGEIWWQVVIERGPEFPLNEKSALMFCTAVGDLFAKALMIATRRCRVVRYGGAYSETYTTGGATMTAKKNGSAVVPALAPVFAAATAGDALATAELAIEGVEVLDTSLDLEEGDVFRFDSDAEGVNGELFMHAALREI